MNLFAWVSIAAVLFLVAWGLNQIVKTRKREIDAIESAKKEAKEQAAEDVSDSRDDVIAGMRRHPSGPEYRK